MKTNGLLVLNQHIPRAADADLSTQQNDRTKGQKVTSKESGSHVCCALIYTGIYCIDLVFFVVVVFFMTTWRPKDSARQVKSSYTTHLRQSSRVILVPVPNLLSLSDRPFRRDLGSPLPRPPFSVSDEVR